ncbi:hypothetical protein SAMN06297422_11470 [Lachnospiraceae bacterium]|nr:hypothetical protein SAMN06297422_11470 [Lachnospiraceae bacterium]
MITLLFIILMFVVFTKIFIFALKAAWGITKIVVSLILLPIVLIAIAIAGFVYAAVAILIIIGLITFITSIAAA